MAATASFAAALSCSACAPQPVQTETHCYVQEITVSDSVIYNAIERGLQAANHGQKIDLKRTTGAQEASLAISNTMGLVMKRTEPQNHDPMGSSIFGWCTTDVREGSAVLKKYIDPLYVTSPAFSVDEATLRYKGNNSLQAMIAKVAPGGYTVAVFPSEAKSPIKPPKQLLKNLPEPDSVAEVINVSKEVVLVGDTQKTIFTADLKNTAFKQIR